ncbi:helix-turn-helix domain-containing protein [Leifsonia sp. 22587]|uniref:helix-turn-helix domain-containing protein n=1 Tax=Leifsonia sp. 22587 TaxID=3453946 RepID=UPI003F8590E3
MNALVRPDGSVVIPWSLREWAADVLLKDVATKRRERYESKRAQDLLELMDALLSDVSQPVIDNAVTEIKIGTEETGGFVVGPPEATSFGVLTARQCADALGVSQRTVVRLIGEGRLKAGRSEHSRTWLITREALDNYTRDKEIRDAKIGQGHGR